MNDMSIVWNSFALDLTTHLENIDAPFRQGLDESLAMALSASTSEPGTNSTGSAMRSLAVILQHRRELTVHGIEQAIEAFHDELNSLHRDAFRSARTTFVGQLMETSYHAANMEYGTPAILLGILWDTDTSS